MESPIPGMETVVASVSGYHGSERFKLIKLISQTGASYVGAMSRATTHLVCWKFEGEKYVLAKKFRIKVVNHQWIEDCIQQGKLLSEGPYMLRSGKEVGPLSLQVPTSDKLPLKSSDVLSDISNIRDGFGSKIDSEGATTVSDSDPVFLNRDLFSRVGESNFTSRKSKLKKVAGRSKQQNSSSSRNHSQDPPLVLPLFEYADSSSSSSQDAKGGKRMVSHSQCYELQTRHVTCSNKGKRNSCEYIGATSLVEPSDRGRRRLKKNSFRGNMETVILDSHEESCPVLPHDAINIAEPAYSVGNVDVNVSENGGTSNHANAPIDDPEHVSDESNNPAWIRSNSCPESSTPSGSPSKHGVLENSNMKLSDVDQLSPTTAAVEASVEITCVICWDERSSTRGVLPCGHRYCYPCIDKWARNMDSMRKVSKCPLCMASFGSIMKVEDADCSDNKIYSQTIPSCAVLPVGGERHGFGTITSTYSLTSGEDRQLYQTESLRSWGCIKCRIREPEDLLVNCRVCGIRVIHSYCLDPHVLPWTCPHCKDLQSLLRRNF